MHNEITDKLVDLPNKGRESFLSFQERIIQSDPEYKAYFGLSKLEVEKIRKIKDNRGNGIRELTEELKNGLSDSDIANIELLLNDGVSFCESHLDETIERHEDKIRKAYTKAATSHIDKYSHYFRNLYHILRYIKESDLISENEKKSYIKIVRSQLSEMEMVAIFYNSLTDIKIPNRENLELGYPKMGRLLEEFDILQNMGNSNIIHRTHKFIFTKNNKETK